jgi:hypothetical protein
LSTFGLDLYAALCLTSERIFLQGASAVQIRNWFLNARRRRSGCHANDVKRQISTSLNSGKHVLDLNSSAANDQRGEQGFGDEDNVFSDSHSESSEDDVLLVAN